MSEKTPDWGARVWCGEQVFPEEKLSKFAKTIIEDCAKDPKNTLPKTVVQVSLFCPKKHYTLKQVGSYLRKARKKYWSQQKIDSQKREAQ